MKEAIRKLRKTIRKYASFFKWHEKGREELGVVETLIRSRRGKSTFDLYNPRINRSDPPDIICEDHEGKTIGVEVTELVCEEATRRNAQGDAVMRNWNSNEVTTHIRTSLMTKDSKIYLGGPYKSIVICIYTDEPLLNATDVEIELNETQFGPYEQIKDAYLMFSYDPSIRSYQTIQLRIAK